MRNSVRKIVTAAALTGALVVVTATPSQAQWYGRGWGWGAPIAAGIGLLAGAVASAVAGPAYYYGGYGYPAYGYNYGWGYPAYGYAAQVYAPGYGYDVGYGGPAVYAGYGWSGYGYAAPSYYGSSYAYGSPYYPSYAYGSPYYRAYGLVRRYGAGPVYARARTFTAERSYALAPRSRVQQYAQHRAPSHPVTTAATDRLTRPVANLARPPVIRATGIKATPVSRIAGVPAAAKAQRRIRSASASEGAYR
jgi:hypothetical protein